MWRKTTLAVVAKHMQLTALDDLAALPFGANHGEVGRLLHFRPHLLLQDATEKVCASVGVLQVRHARGAPVLHHGEGRAGVVDACAACSPPTRKRLLGRWQGHRAREGAFPAAAKFSEWHFYFDADKYYI
jgi:hypothetical protein